jgi:hypothetical protein
MREFTTVIDIVEDMEENEILAYITQPVVVDVVENFFMKKFSRPQLLNYPLNLLEDSIKRMYINSYPESAGDYTFLQSFADDVIFYLCAKLSNQEVIKKVDDVFVYSHIINIYSSFQVPEGEKDKLIYSYTIHAQTLDRVDKYVNEWIKDNVLPNVLEFVYWEIQG